MQAELVLLPGDGIGPEVVASAVSVLNAVAARYHHSFGMTEHLIGGCAIDATGTALPDDSLQASLQADAVLLGAVGGPKWDNPSAKVRPEQGLLAIRKAMDLYANLRPVKPHPQLLSASPIKPEKLLGVDLVVVRELTGGVYFGEPRLRREINGEIQAVDSMTYTQSEIRRVAHTAFKLAQQRRKKLCSIDKANILETSRLWRTEVNAVAGEYPDVEVEHILVDAAAMFLITRPAAFDVIVTENLFGDILTDEASVLTGSMGNLPSASIGAGLNRHGRPRGLYEPIHGSAPDIAGKGIANPIGTILSAALALRYSLGLEVEAAAVEAAVDGALSAGCRTADLAPGAEKVLGTLEMTQQILKYL